MERHLICFRSPTVRMFDLELLLGHFPQKLKAFARIEAFDLDGVDLCARMSFAQGRQTS